MVKRKDNKMNRRFVSKSLMFILLFLKYAGIAYTQDITIDAAAPAKPIQLHNFYGGYHHNRFYFERSTAFKKAHDIINESAHKRPAIKYVRLQNIFTYRHQEDGTIKQYTEDRSGHCYDTDLYASTGGYNWTKVNEVYDELVTRSGLTPIVEFNYMPECMAEDSTEIGSYDLAVISPPEDHNEWRSLVRNTVSHLQGRYGVQETRRWYWGVWNEPDSDEFWRRDYNEFIKLYDFSAIALKEIDGELNIGGPDNAGRDYNEPFVQHTSTGTNYCTGEGGSPADYFSVHAYMVSVRGLCRKVWSMAEYIRDAYPEDYASKKILLTETAPAWQNIMAFLHSRYTAAWMLGLVDTFIEAADIHGEFYLPEAILYCGILRDFGKRSVMVYMGEDNEKDEVLKTPLSNVYEALSFLSDERIPVQGCDFPDNYLNVTKAQSIVFNQVRCMATRTPGQSIEILVYHLNQDDRLVYNEKDDEDNPELHGTYYSANPVTHQVNLTVDNIPFTHAKYTKYVIDKDHSNSFAYRAMHGTTNDYSLLNAHDDLEQTENKIITISSGNYTENMEIQQNSMTLIILENQNYEPGPHLGVSPTSLDFDAHTTVDSFSVYNYGDETLTWTASENPGQGWIKSITPSSGNLAQDDSTTVTITIDRSGLADGNYTGDVVVTSNGGSDTTNVYMLVSIPPQPPQNVNVEAQY